MPREPQVRPGPFRPKFSIMPNGPWCYGPHTRDWSERPPSHAPAARCARDHPGRALVPWVLAPGASAAALGSMASTSSTRAQPGISVHRPPSRTHQRRPSAYSPGGAGTRVRLGPGARVRSSAIHGRDRPPRAQPWRQAHANAPYARERGSDMTATISDSSSRARGRAKPSARSVGERMAGEIRDAPSRAVAGHPQRAATNRRNHSDCGMTAHPPRPDAGRHGRPSAPPRPDRPVQH
jgi:hypothetical protein